MENPNEQEQARCPETSMEKWIQEHDPYKDDPEKCRACRLGVITNWYYNELEERGHTDLAKTLEKISSKEDLCKDPAEVPLTICKVLDIIKDVVEPPLRERLEDFDCATQSFNPDEVQDEAASAVIP